LYSGFFTSKQIKAEWSKMKHTRKAQLTTIISTFLLAMSGTAIAQTEQDAGEEYGEDILEEVIVVAQSYRNSLASSIATKENSAQIVDAVTAEDMGRFPAQNLAEAMQGITGVTMTSDDGAGEFISIRGMAPELTRVEINGRSVSLTAGSANPENATTLSFFSPDMFNKVTVIKSPRAIDVEGGVGGTVQLETLRPLDVGKFMTRVAGSYGTNTVKKDPRYNVGIFSNMLFSDSVGLTIGANWTDSDRRTDQTESLDGWSLVDDDDPALGYYPERVRMQQRVGEQPRFNINATLQWQVNDSFELWTDFLYAQEDRNEVQQRLEVEYDRGRYVDGTVGDNENLVVGFFERARLTTNFLDRKRDITQYGFSFGGLWLSDLWTIKGKLDYSESEEDTFEARARARANRAEAGYDARNLDFLTVIEFPGSTDMDPFLYGEPDFPNYNRLDWNMRNIGTDETAASLDFQRVLGGVFSEFYFGTRFASKEVRRGQGSVADSEIDGFQDPSWSYHLLENEFFFDTARDPLITNWTRPETGEMHQYTSEVKSVVDFNPEDTWSFTEDTIALYAMVDFENLDGAVPYTGNFGVRYVDYNYKGKGWQTDPENVDEFLPYDPKVDQNHWLPSLNTRFSIGDADKGRYIRFAAGRVLSRPNPQFIKPIAELSSELDSVEVGNPNLDPYLAWQYDLAYEYYFGDTGEGLFSFGLFYKDVENFFEEVSLENQDLSPWGVDDTGTINTYVNGGSGKSHGFEASFQTPFTMFDNFMQNFGIVLNYTYVDSERKTDDGEKAPMPGTSKHSANMVFYYAKERMDVRLVYNYRDDYLFNQDDQKYVEGAGRLDFAFRYTFLESLVLSFDVANITEVSQYGYYDDIKTRFHKLQLEGRRVAVGLSYTFQ